MKGYCEFLMRKFEKNFDPRGPGRAWVHRRYQATGRKLVRWNFRVESRFWVELGLAANYLGVSRCLLFVFLLQQEAHARDPDLEKSREYQRHKYSLLVLFGESVNLVRIEIAPEVQELSSEIVKANQLDDTG